MRILLVTALNENRSVFEKAWNILRETFPMPTASLSGVYISEFQEDNLKEIYTVKDLRAYRENRARISNKDPNDPDCVTL